MKNIAWHYEPLEKRPAFRTRSRSLFKASFSATMALLERELAHLQVRAAVLQLDVDREDFRLDGSLRAHAKHHSPAVALAFSHRKHGELVYPCDTYATWQENMRAIALSLAALRTVDRYGVTSRGEQYTGWARLPAPAAQQGEFRSHQEAFDFLRGVGVAVPNPITPAEVEPVLRAAEFKTHPDKGGDPDVFKRVQAARRILTKLR